MNEIFIYIFCDATYRHCPKIIIIQNVVRIFSNKWQGGCVVVTDLSKTLVSTEGIHAATLKEARTVWYTEGVLGAVQRCPSQVMGREEAYKILYKLSVKRLMPVHTVYRITAKVGTHLFIFFKIVSRKTVMVSDWLTQITSLVTDVFLSFTKMSFPFDLHLIPWCIASWTDQVGRQNPYRLKEENNTIFFRTRRD